MRLLIQKKRYYPTKKALSTLKIGWGKLKRGLESFPRKAKYGGVWAEFSISLAGSVLNLIQFARTLPAYILSHLEFHLPSTHSYHCSAANLCLVLGKHKT